MIFTSLVLILPGFFLLWKTITISWAKIKKAEAAFCSQELADTSVPNVMEIVQAVKEFNLISWVRLSFRRRPILCTALFRNPIQASHFGRSIDQLFLWTFYAILTQNAPPFFYTMVQRSLKWPKTPIKGSYRTPFSEANLVIFGRRALIFFVWKYEKLHHFCAHAQGDHLGDANMSKKAPCLVEFNFFFFWDFVGLEPSST